jgi:hypothetical protein
MSLVHARFAEEKGRGALTLAGALLPLPDVLAAQARVAPSPELLVGLRPQQVELAERTADGAVAATVYSHGMVGREQQLMLTLGSDEVRCRTTRSIRVAAGDRVGLAVSLIGAKLFDAESGGALPPAS